MSKRIVRRAAPAPHRAACPSARARARSPRAALSGDWCRAISASACDRDSAFAEQEHHLAGFAGLERDANLHRRARIHAGAEFAGQAVVAERRRPGHRSVAADERAAVAGRRDRPLAARREADPSGERGVVRIPRQDRLVLRVVVGDHVARVELARRTDHPVVVGEHAQVAAGSATC